MAKARAALLFLLLLLPLGFRDAEARPAPLLTVAFLDVGQGDAIYIEAPNGRQMIVDGGPGSALLPALEEVMPFGDRSVDVIMVTNPDADHYSGFIDLLDGYDVGAIIESGTVTDTKLYAEFAARADGNAIPRLLARKGMRISLDSDRGVEFLVLFPDREISGWSRNDGSIMGILSYGKTRVFFTGDGTTTTENAVMLRTEEEYFKSDILKVGHHGSRTSTGDAFVRAVGPEYAVISLGADNRYGHPHAETLRTLSRYGAGILRTDQEGTILFRSDGVSYWRE